MESVKVPEKRCNVFGESVRVNADRKARVEKRYRKARMNFARAKAEKVLAELREVIDKAKVSEHAPNGAEIATYASRDTADRE